ncbi:MAG: Dabb family protein [Betaproteobacteria bacterium]
MFVHLVLIKFKPGITRADARVPVWQAKFAALEHKCKGIVRFEHGLNVTDRPIAYDYGINMAFATRADLEAYGPNPDHQEVVAALREIADWVICDYEIPE